MKADAVVDGRYVRMTVVDREVYTSEGDVRCFRTHAEALWHVMSCTPYRDYESRNRRCRVRAYGDDVCVDFYQDETYMGTEWHERVATAIEDVREYVR